MKNQIVALSVVTLVLLTGCEEKQQPSSSVSKELPPSVQRPIESAKEVKKESAKQLPVVVESKTVQQVTPVVTKQTAEESLAEVAKHGREVTKTQVSKSRTRAQQAEEEMLKEMSAHK